ncbi:hypothetical protein JHK86_048876 [Glycine max]|nr:hypothetical protein JHK86_048876 [Glycine max]
MIFLRFIIGVDNQIFSWRSGSSTGITKIRKVSQFFLSLCPVETHGKQLPQRGRECGGSRQREVRVVLGFTEGPDGGGGWRGER